MTRKLDWTNLIFICALHLLAAVAVVYMATVHFSWWTLGLGVLWFALCGLGITGGYHRLFAHPTYKAAWPLRLLYLLFGAASVQNSALKWSADHRIHHAKVDEDEDPYNIKRGFWWAHIGWVFFESPDYANQNPGLVKDLRQDPLVLFQDRHYVLIALLVGAVLPGLIGLAWGDPIGALLVAGALRLVVQWHATFAVNSVTHMWGSQPYTTKNSARDSWVAAIITLGEGYHNFHHRFQADYRNGIRWFHLDPTKWFVWTMSKVGVTSNLRRTSDRAIQRARQMATEERAAQRQAA